MTISQLAKASLVVVLVVLPGVAQAQKSPTRADPKPPIEPKAYEGKGWAIAAPSDWRVFNATNVTMPLYLIGDGQSGVPILDGTLAPVKAGLLVEVFDAKGESLEQRVTRELGEMKSQKRFSFIEEPVVENVKLPDGTAARRSLREFIRKDNARLSVQAKVYAASNDRHIIATGFVTCSPASRKFVHDVGLVKFLAAHVDSLVLDPAKMDLKRLDRSYAAHSWNTNEAIELTIAGNRHLSRESYEDATSDFRKALKINDSVSAAHNGLAWSLLHRDASDKSQLEDGLSYAKTAVEQTEERDAASLDTLAVAFKKNGMPKEAVTSLKKAIGLDPRNPELLERLEEFEGQP